MNLTIDAKSAKLGGAVTYLRNILPEVRKRLEGEGNRLVVLRPAAAPGDTPWPEGFEYLEYGEAGDVEVTRRVDGLFGRLWYDQVTLPRMLRESGVDVLFSAANFGSLRSPCRQVLLMQNTIYFDPVYLRRMRSRKVLLILTLQRWLSLRSIKAAEVVLFPSQAMIDLVARWTNGPRANWRVAHYGIRRDTFSPAPGAGNEVDRDAGRPARLLHVSHYGDQKNLGVLLEAVQQLQQAEPGRYSLRLTAGFEQDELGKNPYFPNFQSEQALYRTLKAAGVAEDVGGRPHAAVSELYGASDLFVFPSYTESFGLPFLEAMASGLPIVAADLPVSREICGEAAVYFETFDPSACAAAIRRVMDDDALRSRMRAASLERVQSFRWEDHARHLVEAFAGA